MKIIIFAKKNMDLLSEITYHFSIIDVIDSIKPLGEGFINDTYYVKTKENTKPNYILQRKNKNIFTDIPAMMDNIYKVTTHLKKKVEETGGNPKKEAMTIIPTYDGKYYYQDKLNDYWTMCIFIENTISYQQANSPEIAYQGGLGLGKFQRLLSDFKEPLHETIIGFHNMKYLYNQWDSAMKNNLASRIDDVKDDIEFIESHRKEMLNFWKLIEDGTIPQRVTHNDTKINNFLFDKNNKLQCVIDLDTVMYGTCLNDFGDAIRTYANTGLEDDKNLDNVRMDKTIFDAYKSGYLSEVDAFLTDVEKQYLGFSARYITFEQVMRFLMDYINGDTYYKIKYKAHNLVRTRAQRKLFETMIF